nr:ribonuclease H-like domain-containing protein [Tanacetum cinerariifolium]
MPPRADLSFARLDDFVFKSKVSETITSLPKFKTNASKTIKDSLEKPKTVRSSAHIIEDWELDSEDENMFEPKKVKKKQSNLAWKRLNLLMLGIQLLKMETKLKNLGILTKSGQLPVNAAKQSSHRAATSVSTARHVTTDVSRPNVNNALPITYSYFTEHSPVLLKVPRNKNMYSFELKNVVPVGGLTCLFAKTTLDEFNLWHRRIGHINFKSMNKLVRGNLARGLPSKIFENEHTCVSCQKGKQHKASCKFDGKSDDGFFVGYSINSKAFREFNTRTKIVEENLHTTFLENKPNVARIGPNWIFDIDTLTMSMNYQLVFSRNQTNGNVGPKSSEDEVADDAGKKSTKVPKNDNRV